MKDIELNGGDNFRQLTGWTTRPGTAALIRGGAMDQLTAADLSRLAAIPVNLVIDLRSEDEVTVAPDRVPVGSDYASMPVFQTLPNSAVKDDVGIVKDAYHDSPALVKAYFAGTDTKVGFNRMMGVYQRLVTGTHPQTVFAAVLRRIFAEAERPGAVIFHCSAGKDRTGFVAYLLQALLGVPDNIIMADYLATNAAIAEKVSNRMAELRTAGANEVVLRNVHDRLTVRPEYLAYVMDTVAAEWGGVNGYVTEWLGLTETEIDNFRQKMIK